MLFIFLVSSLLVFFNALGGTPTCPHGWEINCGGDSCIQVVTDQKKKFDDANAECHNRGGHLATSLTSVEQMDRVKDRTRCRAHFWIGVSSREGDNTFYYDNGTSVVMSTAPFVSGHPRNNGRDNCVTLREGFWHDQSCIRRYHFICEQAPTLVTHPQSNDDGCAPITPAPANKTCSVGWDLFNQSETCFKVVGDQWLMWEPARNACKEMGGDLATVPNQETMDFLNGIIMAIRYYWIGLVDKGKNGTFSWVGQDTETEFKAWFSPPLNDLGDEYCVELIGSVGGKWNDKPCTVNVNFICEKPATIPNQNETLSFLDGGGVNLQL